MAGFIDSAVQDIDNRLQELKDEESRLLAARAALTGGSARVAPARPAPTRTRAASGSPRRRAGRPRGRRAGNTRAAQALELVRKQPGVTIPEIATTMGIEPNYLYRVMPKLIAEGLITREGQGWHPAPQGGGQE